MSSILVSVAPKILLTVPPIMNSKNRIFIDSSLKKQFCFSSKSEMPEMNFSILWFFLGLVVGVALDYLWRKTGMSKHERRLKMFEHFLVH